MENDVQVFQQMLHFDSNLYNDVQVMVDTEGHLFHVDTDRAFQKKGPYYKSFKKKYDQTLNRAVEEARQAYYDYVNATNNDATINNQ